MNSSDGVVIRRLREPAGAIVRPVSRMPSTGPGLGDVGMGTEAGKNQQQQTTAIDRINARRASPGSGGGSDRYEGVRRANVRGWSGPRRFAFIAGLLGALLAVLALSLGPRSHHTTGRAVVLPWVIGGASDQIASGPALATPPAATTTPGGSAAPEASPTPSATTVSAAAVPTTAGSASPVTPRAVAGATPRPAPPTPPPLPAVSPVAVQAEDPGNELHGALVAKCPTCEGGAKVIYLGGSNYLVVHTAVAVAGRWNASVSYESAVSRPLKVSVNGASPRTFTVAAGGDWLTPRVFTFPVDVTAGPVIFRFYHETDQMPDLDKVVLNPA
ncbi:hypothetical protein [Micromonospora sp. NPDC005174]|uniref:hypothetical protein n=1 Tax=Micromonospora sp. NPDC005174 TaxID=3157018 RepID=UPI0033AA6C58